MRSTTKIFRHLAERRSWIAVFFVFLSCAPESLTADGDSPTSPNSLSTWSQWRGPRRDGTTSTFEWPADLSERSLVRQWTVPLQESYSGPIVEGNTVVTTETVDKQREQVVALDRNSGETRWTQSWDGALRVPFFAASRGSWIRSTPASDGERIFVGGIRDRLVALDVGTGEVVWDLDLVQQFRTPLPNFGFVSSPLIDGDALYVQAGGGVCKIKCQTGEIVWRGLADGGGMSGSAFSSPVIASLFGQRQLVVQGREQLAGLSLDDGRVLWSVEVPAFRGMNILTPTIWQQKLFTSSYGGKSFLYRVQADANPPRAELQWENKLQGYMSSPIVIDKHAYIHLRNRRFACIDLATGKESWITKPFGEYWSMIAQQDRILALDEQGELLLIRANPEKFDLIGRRTVVTDDSAWAHLANDGDQLFVRGLKQLVAYRWK